MAKILLVDDDVDLTKSLHLFLTEQGQTIDYCGSGEDALQLLQSSTYDLIVLDWSLPGITGEQVCRTFRARGGQAPIIFLTGRGDIDSVEAGLNAGADDYMRKPFHIRELTARIKSTLSRKASTTIASLTVNGLTFDPVAKTVSDGTTTEKLRAKEAALMEFFIRHPGRIYSAQQILDAVWSADGGGTTDSVRTWMNLLRKKLSAIGKTNAVRTVLGSGYILDE